MADSVEQQELPPYVSTDADKARWARAEEHARTALGEDATPENVWEWQRLIFHDRDQFPD